jgi:hypothetical protein
MKNYELEALIQKYERLQEKANSNLKDMKNNVNTTKEFQTQRVLLSVWRMVLKDLKFLADNKKDENKQQTY